MKKFLFIIFSAVFSGFAMAGGDGGFVRFENISSSDVVVVGRAANVFDFGRVFPRCVAMLGD